jgi:glycine cleavage system transcriptional repressor
MAVGTDRPGIVAAISEALLDQGLNIEDSQMTILRGHFAMILIVAGPERAGLEERLAEAAARAGLDSVHVSEVPALPPGHAVPSHVVTVYGADHPGIVHAVAAALGDRDVNITDLNTRLLSEGLYVMMLEVTLPGGMVVNALEQALAAVGEEQGVEVTIRPLESDAL